MASLEGSFTSVTNGSSGSSFEEDSAYSSPRSTEYNVFSPTLSFNNADLFLITCSLCSNTYTEPKVLSCFHTFCSMCLESKKEEDVIKCHLCEAETLLPAGGVSELPSDYGVLNLIHAMKGKLFCTSCKHNLPNVSIAVAKCVDCHSYLCQNCVLAHNYMHCFEGHRVIQFSQDLCKDDPTSVSVEHALTFCPKHKAEELKYFCFQCNDPICDTCLSNEHLSENHNCELISKVADTLLKDMIKSLEEGKCKKDGNRSKKEFTELTARNLYLQFQDGKKKVNETFDYIYATITKQRTEQLKSIEKAFTLIFEALNRSLKTSDKLQMEYEVCIEFFSRLLKNSNVSQCLLHKKLFENKIEKLVEEEPKRMNTTLRFVNNYNAIHASLLNTFGYVNYNLEVLEPTNSNNLNQLSLTSAVPSLDAAMNKALDKFSALNLTDPNLFKTKGWNPKLMADPLLNDYSSFFPVMDHSLEAPVIKISRSLRSYVSRTQIAYNWRFGSYGNQEGQFSEPNGVAVNSQEDIIVADTNNNRVQVFDKTGSFKFQFGDMITSNGQRQLLFPNRVAVALTSGDIVVTERAPTHQVQIFTQNGRFLRRFGADILQHPRALTVDNEDTIIIVECKVMRVILFNQYGKLLHKFMCGSDLKFPNGVAVNNQKEIFISDNRSHCVMVYDYSGSHLRNIGQEGITNFPIGVLISPRGNILIADNHNNFNLTIFTPDGQLVAGMESKIKHAQCFDVALTNSSFLVLTCKDYHVYLYALSNI